MASPCFIPCSACLQAWIHLPPGWRQTSSPTFRTNVIHPDKLLLVIPSHTLAVGCFLPCIHTQCWIRNFCLLTVPEALLSCLLVPGFSSVLTVILPVTSAWPSKWFVFGIHSVGMPCYQTLSNSVLMTFKWGLMWEDWKAKSLFTFLNCYVILTDKNSSFVLFF